MTTESRNDVEFAVMGEDRFEEMKVFLNTHYFPREPLCRGLGVGTVDIHEGSRMGADIQRCLSSGLSIAAIDLKSRDLVGVMLSYACTRGEEEDSPLPPFELEAMFERDDLVSDAVPLFEDPNVKTVHHLYILCVREDFCGRGIATDVVKECVHRGARDEARAIASNRFTQSLFRKLGFTCRFTLDLVADPGMNIAAMQGTTTSCLMIKRMP